METIDYKDNNNKNNRIYIAIDLKSFYASVECRERGLDPLDANLVVADASRTEKTICLAVSPALKSYGIPGRARLFEVVAKLKEVNAKRRYHSKNRSLDKGSYLDSEIKADDNLYVDYIAAPPRMALYIDYSTRIYNVYLKYIAPEDIHVYSIDEVIMDVTEYLMIYNLTPKELTSKIIKDVYETTGITATAGIGTNMYLCKIAMDIVAKHVAADENGVRIAELDEMSYRKQLWNHKPITDFWRVGRGYANRLAQVGIYTMGDVARCSAFNEELLYKMFGVNAELLIDHAWGYEPCTIAQVKAYKPMNNSYSQGQVLHCPYDFDKARIVIEEMADAVALDLLDKNMVTNQMVLTVGYDVECLTNPDIKKYYKGEITTDHYGRKVPKHAHSSINLQEYTLSSKKITEAVLELYDRIVNKKLLIRRMNLTTNHVIPRDKISEYEKNDYEQLDLFTDYEAIKKEKEHKEAELKKEEKVQEAMLAIKKKYGKNALLKGTSYKDGATAKQRNGQIGGHKA